LKLIDFEMIRLCFINPTNLHRAMVYGLAKHLSEKQFKITILQPTNLYIFEQFDEWANEKIKIIRFPAFFFPKINYTIPLIPEVLKIMLKLADYDILQVGDYFYPTSILPLISCRKREKPMILTVNALPGYNWSFGSAIIDLIARAYTYSLGKKILGTYDKIVVLYHKLSEDLKKLGIPAEKICVIPNGVDIEKFQSVQKNNVFEIRRKLSISDKQRILLFVGRLSEVKRVELVIRLTQKLIREGWPIKTIIVGDGYCRKRYEKMASTIRDRIIFTGWVSRKALVVFYAIADIILLPSFSEGLPNVLLEAAAAGKPAVATRINGTPDIIVHGKTGFLFDRSDFNSFYRFTKLILSNRDLQEELGRNALKHVKEKFSWEKVVEKYESLYDKLE